MPTSLSYRKGAGVARSTRVKVVKRFRWSMAHRLTHDYKGRCASLHGHEYELGVTIAGEVDAMGLVVDFAVVKDICDGWIKKHLDHTTVVYAGDTTLVEFLKRENQRHYIVDFNTTAENLAAHLKEILQEELNRGVDRQLSVVNITLMETPTSSVEVG